jgi:hypothetical protein
MQQAPPLEEATSCGRPQQGTARTGEHCPLSGWWTDAAPTREPTRVYVAKGSLMPATRGEPTTWISGPTRQQQS